MRRIAKSTLCAGLWLIACASLPTDSPVNHRISVTSSPAMREWWARVEQCSGVHANYNAARFYLVPADVHRGIDGKGPDSLGFVVAGWTIGNTIMVGMPWATRGDIWMHEMGHIKASHGWHNPEVYQRRCAGVMSCEGSCLTDTLPPRR